MFTKRTVNKVHISLKIIRSSVQYICIINYLQIVVVRGNKGISSFQNKKPKLNCFNSERWRAFISCLDLVSQKKTSSTDINMLKRQPPNEKLEMFSWYVGNYTSRKTVINFGSAKEVSMNAEKEMIGRDVLREQILR